MSYVIDENSPTTVDAVIQGEQPTEDRIKQLQESLNITQQNIASSLTDNEETLKSIIVLTFLLLLATGGFICYLLFCVTIPATWTWQIAYYTTIRVTIVSGLFAFLSFCLKLLRSYLQICQKSQHRLTIIKSMASLVESATFEDRKRIYNKLLDIVIEFGETGLLSKGDDISLPTSLLTEILKEKIIKEK